MDTHLFITILTLFLTISLTTLVGFGNFKKRKNITFSFLGLVVSAWIFSNFMADSSNSLQSALFWSKTAIIWPSLLPLLFYLFVKELYYKNSNKIQGNIFFVYVLVSFFIIVLSSTSLNIQEVEMFEWGVSYTPGFLYYVLFLYLILGFSWPINLLIRIYRNGIEPLKSQAKYILIGSSVSVLLGILASIIFPLMGYAEVSVLGPPSVVFFVGFMALAILRHRLFSLKVIVAEISIIILCLLLFMRAVLSSGMTQVFHFFLVFISMIFGFFMIRGVFRDIEDRKRIQQLGKDLVVANDQLRQMDKQKSDFVSIASHQLRTPLTAIKGYASLILEGSFGQTSDKVYGAIKKIFESSQRMVMVVENFLTVSRIEQGKMYYKFETFDLQCITKKMVEEMRPVAQGYGLEIRFRESTELQHLVRVDYVKIKQVIHNLLDDSIGHTSEGFINVSIFLSQFGDSIVLSISDTGKGATKKDLERIFEKYESEIDENEIRKETGVELFIVQEIIKAHRGEVWAESEGLGKGLTYFIKLPIVKDKISQ